MAEFDRIAKTPSPQSKIDISASSGALRDTEGQDGKAG
jgi:hypothetical protein